MNKTKKSLPGSQLQDTLRTIHEALTDWEKIPDGVESEMDKFRKKTKELLERLSTQMKALDL